MKPPMNVQVIRDNDSLVLLKDFFSRKKEYGLDTETNVVRDLNARYVRTIQVGDKDEQYIIDLLPFAQCAVVSLNLTPGELIKEAQRDPNLRQQLYGGIIDTLRPTLESREWLKVGHNLQFEYEMLKLRFGLRPWHLWDTMLAEKVLLCGLVPPKAEGYFAMDDVMAKYCKVSIDKKLQTSFDDFSLELTPDQIIYAALDTRFPFAIRIGQTNALTAARLMPTAQIEFDAIPAFGDMRVNGFFCNPKKWMKKYEENVLELKHVIHQLDEVFIPIVGQLGDAPYTLKDIDNLEEVWRQSPKPERGAAYRAYLSARGELTRYNKIIEDCQGAAQLNYASNVQLRDAMLKIGIKISDTNDKTLEKFKHTVGAKKYVAIIDLIQKYRALSKSVTSYGENFLEQFVSKISGRIHSNINQIGAGTGRTSSDNPNIQNIPYDEDYRSCFEARPGYKVVTVDVAGCELRIISDMSGEPVWIEAFNKKWDVHSLGAEFVYSDKWATAAEPGCCFCDGRKLKCECKGHSKIRKPIKNVNFGVIYGLSEMGYARDTGKTHDEARNDLRRYKLWVPVLWKYLDSLSDNATFLLESRTTLGRRRLFKRPLWESAKKHLIEKEKAKFKDRPPNEFEVNRQLAAMWSAIGREGRNAPVQGGNVDLMKLAMGCGFDSNGKPFLWHRLEPEFGALLENLVHDELVMEAPDATAKASQEATHDAIVRAGHEIYKKVDMDTDGGIANYWSK